MIRWLLLALLLLCDIAYADNGKLFAMSCDTDLSAQFLTNIFGHELLSNICTVNASNSPLGSIFSIFNSGLLIIASGFISYAVVSGALGKASDGGQAAGGKSNPWVPVRLATGTSMLVPMKSGYSMVQLIVMWAVMHGVGLANAIWYKQIDLLQSPPTIEAQKSSQTSYSYIFGNFAGGNSELGLSKGNKLKVTDIYAVGTCLAVLEKANQAARAFNSSIPVVRYTVSRDCFDDQGVSLGPNYFCAGGDLVNKNACGVFEKHVLQNNTNEAKKQANLEDLNSKIETSIIAAKESARLILDSPISTQNIGDLESCNNASSVCAKLRAIYLRINSPIESMVFIPKPEITEDDNSWADSAKQLGWLTAGQHYYKFSAQTKGNTQEYDFNDSTKYLPKIVSSFKFPGYDSKDRETETDKITNKDTNKMFSGAAKDSLQHLLKRITYSNNRGVLASIKENIASTKSNIGITDGRNSEKPVNQTMQGALLLKNNMFNALVFPIKNIDQTYEDSVFQAYSHNSFLKISLTAPLYNLLNMTSAAAASLTGLDLRKYSSIRTYELSSLKSKDRYNSIISACRNTTDSFEEGCILENAGIIGYLKSHYHGSSNDGEKVKSSRTIDPVSNLSTIGRQLINFAVNYWVDTLSAVYSTTTQLVTFYSIEKVMIALSTGAASSIPFFGGVVAAGIGVMKSVLDIWYKLDTFTLNLFLPIGLALSAVIFVLGVMLGLYLPFLPFMIFLFTGIGWVIAVIEAMIAAPLVALGITHPQGHDLLGKAEQSVILLLGIFIRPSAIILGFIAAIFLLKEAMVFVNTGFLTMLTNTFSYEISSASSNELIINNVIVIGILIIYVYIIMAVINQVFSLIYQVPEKLLRWIGAAPENTGISQIAGEVKQGVQSGAQTMAQGGQQMGGQKPEMQTANVNDLEKASTKLGKKGRKKIEGKLKSRKGGSGAKTSGGKGGK